MKDSIRQFGRRARAALTPTRFVILIAVIALFCFLVLGDQGIYQFRQLLEMKHRLTAERAKVNREIDSLTREREILKDPENLEMIIRSELGFIRPGEVLFEEKAAEEQ